jgi:hypothetical protein
MKKCVIALSSAKGFWRSAAAAIAPVVCFFVLSNTAFASNYDEQVLESGLKYMTATSKALSCDVTNLGTIKGALKTSNGHSLDDIDDLDGNGIGYKSLGGTLFDKISGDNGLFTKQLKITKLAVNGVEYGLTDSTDRDNFAAHVSDLIRKSNGHVIADVVYDKIIGSGKTFTEIDTNFGSSNLYSSTLKGLLPNIYFHKITDPTLNNYKYIFINMIESFCNAVSEFTATGPIDRGIEFACHLHSILSNAADAIVLGGFGENIKLSANEKPMPVHYGRLVAIKACFNEFLTASLCGAIESSSDAGTGSVSYSSAPLKLGHIMAAAVKKALPTDSPTPWNDIKGQLPQALANYLPTS